MSYVELPQPQRLTIWADTVASSTHTGGTRDLVHFLDEKFNMIKSAVVNTFLLHLNFKLYKITCLSFEILPSIYQNKRMLAVYTPHTIFLHEHVFALTPARVVYSWFPSNQNHLEEKIRLFSCLMKFYLNLNPYKRM